LTEPLRRSAGWDWGQVVVPMSLSFGTERRC